jgi:hypothetical protein
MISAVRVWTHDTSVISLATRLHVYIFLPLFWLCFSKLIIIFIFFKLELPHQWYALILWHRRNPNENGIVRIEKLRVDPLRQPEIKHNQVQ